MKEMTGSGIFIGEKDTEESGNANSSVSNRTGIRMYQVSLSFLVDLTCMKIWISILHIDLYVTGWNCQQAIAGISHISFSEDESVSPKKPTTLPEVAKQRELSGTLESEDAKLKKQLSDAKCKELSGHDIFAPPPEILPRPVTARTLDLKGSIEIGESATPNVRTSVKVSNLSELHLHVCLHTCLCTYTSYKEFIGPES